MPETHVIQLPKRTCKLEVIEEPGRIVLKLRCSIYGEDLGDTDEISKWLWPVFERFDSDPRQIFIDNPSTGQTATVWGDANNSMVFYEPPKT